MPLQWKRCSEPGPQGPSFARERPAGETPCLLPNPHRGVVKWHNGGLQNRGRGFDSLHPCHSTRPPEADSLMVFDQDECPEPSRRATDWTLTNGTIFGTILLLTSPPLAARLMAGFSLFGVTAYDFRITEENSAVGGVN